MSDHQSEHDTQPEGAAVDPMATHETFHVDFFEGAWMRVAVAVTVVFVIALAISGFAIGVQLPGAYARITPTELADPASPFANPGLRELAPGKYEAYVVAQTWNFLPAEIRVPGFGSDVLHHGARRAARFQAVGHQCQCHGAPGQVSTLKAIFDEPGTYDYICHEYCGYVEGSPIGHHTMYGQLIVEGADGAGATAAVVD
ncbi:MAG: hypothetical protein R2838_22380 [Caldilineaceae bacterium]